MTTVVGLDLSLTSTGVAIVAAGRVIETHRVRSTGRNGALIRETAARIDTLAQRILEHVTHGTDLVVIEAPSFASKNGQGHERAGLWWRVACDVSDLGVPIGTVAPMTLKVYATGDGRADKGAVVAAVRERYVADWVEAPNNDEADAIVLAAMGSRKLGRPLETGLSDKQLKAIETARWLG